MKQKGKCLVGDPIHISSYTAKWMTVKLHPSVFYRRFEEFQKGFEQVKGLYAELDMGEYVLIRFSEKEDVTNFHRRHHQYV